MIIRQATQADIPVLVTLRMALFCEVGELSEPLADLDLWQATSRYFSTAQAEESARSMSGSVLWPIPLIWSGSPGDPSPDLARIRRRLHCEPLVGCGKISAEF